MSRLIVSNLGRMVLAQQLAVPKTSDAFTPEGQLKDPKQQGPLEKYVEAVLRAIIKLDPSR